MAHTDFEKGYTLNRWSSDIYKISVSPFACLTSLLLSLSPRLQARVPSRPPRYKLVKVDGEVPVQGSFYFAELKSVSDDEESRPVYPIEKVLRRRRNRATGRPESLVRFKGVDRHIEWVDDSLLSREPIVPVL